MHKVGSRNRVDIPQLKKIASSHSRIELASIFGVKPEHISRLCKRHGVSCKRESVHRFDRERFCELAASGRFTAGQIANILNTSKTYVKRLCDEYGYVLQMSPEQQLLRQRMLDIWEGRAEESKGLPRETTSAPPGSAEKIQVLRERADQMFDLFHPRDRNDCAGMRGSVIRDVD